MTNHGLSEVRARIVKCIYPVLPIYTKYNERKNIQVKYNVHCFSHVARKRIILTIHDNLLGAMISGTTGDFSFHFCFESYKCEKWADKRAPLADINTNDDVRL